MKTIIAAAGLALALSVTGAAAQTFDDEGFGWGPYYNNHLSPWDGRALGPPLAALPPGARYYNGMPRVGYPVTPGAAGSPERAYRYPSYRPAHVGSPRRAVRKHRPVKRRIVERR
jgi:hypothetical protein